MEAAIAASERTCQVYYARGRWCKQCMQRTSSLPCCSRKRFHTDEVVRALECAKKRDEDALALEDSRSRRGAKRKAVSSLDAYVRGDDTEHYAAAGAAHGSGSTWGRRRRMAAQPRQCKSSRPSVEPSATAEADALVLELEGQLREVWQREAIWVAERSLVAQRKAQIAELKAEVESEHTKFLAKRRQHNKLERSKTYFREKTSSNAGFTKHEREVASLRWAACAASVSTGS